MRHTLILRPLIIKFFLNEIWGKPTGFSAKTHWVSITNQKMQTVEEQGAHGSEDDMEVIVGLIWSLLELMPLIPEPKKRQRRTTRNNLPYHKRRRRVHWAQWVRELGPQNFYRHHRMTRRAFEKLLTITQEDIKRDARKCRYGSGPITVRMQLTITLKHLGGDSSHDIEKHMGGTLCYCCSCSRLVVLFA